MNKTLKIKFLTLIVVLIALTFIGCETEPNDPTYTVWTDTISYSEYLSIFGTLGDGYYIRYEFTSVEWSQISQNLTSEGRHNWSESQIRNWFIGRGFGNSEANRETAWLLTINHGFIASRTGSLVYMILK